MISAIVIWLFIPYLNKSKQRSCDFKIFEGVFFWILFLDFIFLGWLGTQSTDDPFALFGALATFYYFAYFLIILPFLPKLEDQIYNLILNELNIQSLNKNKKK